MPHLPKSICSWKKSWLKYHTRYCIEHNKYFVYPYVSLSTCFSDAGEHTGDSMTIVQVPLLFGNKDAYHFAPTVRYDAFFENQDLSSYLNIPPSELCVDIYGEKNKRENLRYWLTRDIKDLKIVKSFGLKLKPVELNIIFGISGSDIFLYDTTQSAPNHLSAKPMLFERYLKNDFVGIRTLLSNLKYAVVRRFFR